jgi:hypothetical protein
MYRTMLSCLCHYLLRSGCSASFHLTSRLVVLKHVTRVAVELVFFQLVGISRPCGVGTLEDTVEMSAMIRCTAGLDRMFEQGLKIIFLLFVV